MTVWDFVVIFLEQWYYIKFAPIRGKDAQIVGFVE